MLPVSMDCPFLIAPSLLFTAYWGKVTGTVPQHTQNETSF
jgi:hypothetical protein